MRTNRNWELIVSRKCAFIGVNLIALGFPAFLMAGGLQKLHIAFDDSHFLNHHLHIVQNVGHGATAIGASLFTVAVILKTPKDLD